MIAGLPYDAEVEYLESTGTQWIDTLIPMQTIRYSSSIEMKGMFLSWTSGWPVIAGGKRVDDFCLCGIHANIDTVYARVNTKIVWMGWYNTPGLLNKIFKVSVSAGGSFVFTLGDVSYPPIALDETLCTSSETGNLSLFSYEDCVRPITGRIYSVKVILHGETIYEAIPVRFTNSNGQSEGAMYDRVSRKLFRNAGTGSFTIGPDVATPVMGLHFFKSQIKTAKDYVQNGLVAMWDGIENIGYGQHDDNATSWIDLTGGEANWLLKDSNTTQVFEVGSDYVKILSDVSYNGRGHCTPSWASGSDITTVEMVIDNTDFDIIGDTMARIVSFGVGNGTFDQTIHIKGLLFAPNIYNKYGQVSLATGLNAVSLEIGSQPVLVNGTFVQSENRTFGGYAYSAPVLGAYAATAAVGLKIKSLRAYGRSLTDTERLANYAVDRVRFNLPSSS